MQFGMEGIAGGNSEYAYQFVKQMFICSLAFFNVLITYHLLFLLIQVFLFLLIHVLSWL